MAGETARTLMPYQALGGSEAIRRIVERFYDLMDSEEQYAELRAMHAADLGPMRSSLAGWLIGWAGGPRNWFLENPGKCIMRAHRALGISPNTAGQWSDAMARAIADCGPENRELGKMVAEKLDLIARAMVVRDA